MTDMSPPNNPEPLAGAHDVSGVSDTTTATKNGQGRMLAIGLVVVVAVVAATVFALGAFGGSASAVTLRSLGSSGDDPFTGAVAAAPSANLSDFAEKGPAGAPLGNTAAGAPTLTQYRTVSATVPGVFGGSLNEQTCDTDQLVAFLTSDDAKAQVWASVLGMDIDNIGAYVATLTGVNLAADTRVLDHGFSDGKLVTRQAVLQRGTAVLVDTRGVPRVDCYSGNPLRQPTVEADETFIGTPWTSFAENEVVVIADAPQDLQEFELVNVDDGESFKRPAGTNGSADLSSAPDSIATEPDVAPTPVPPTPVPTLVPVTRDLTVVGDIALNDRVTGEVGSTEDELIYAFDAPNGARLVIQATNDRASVGAIAVDVRSRGDRIEFFRVQPGAQESFALTLSNEGGGEYEVVITEGPGAFEFVVQSSLQDDAGQGRDAGAEFASALEISGGETVAGHLGGMDLNDVYVLDLVDAPFLVFTASVERGSDRAVGFDLELPGDGVEFLRVNPAAQETFEVLFGPGDDLMELYITEGPGEYVFTAELTPQQDGDEAGDAGNDLAQARVVTSPDPFTGQVGDRDKTDYFLFDAPADQFTVSVQVSVQSPRPLGVDLVGPDGARIDFIRVEPGVTGSIEVDGIEGSEGETYRLIMTEGRADYEVSFS